MTNVLPELLVTWIAPVLPPPAQPLMWLDEIGSISKIDRVQLRVLTGNVLLNDVSKVLGNPAHAVIFSGHGKPRGLALSDGSYIQPQWFASQVKKAVISRLPFLAVLAACASNDGELDLPSMAAIMCRRNITTVGMPAEIGDAMAAKFTIELIRAFVNKSIGDAFDVARESIYGQPLSSKIFLMAGLDPRPRYMAADIDDMLSSLSRIEGKLEIHRQDEQEDTTPHRDVESHVSTRPVTRSGDGNGGGIIGLSAADPAKKDETAPAASKVETAVNEVPSGNVTSDTATLADDVAVQAATVATLASDVATLSASVATEVAKITKPAE